HHRRRDLGLIPMMLFTFLLRSGADPGGPEPDPTTLSRSLQAWAGLVGGPVEHVTTRAGPDGLYLGLFYRTTDAAEARQEAERTCRELLAIHSELAGWEVLELPGG